MPYKNTKVQQIRYEWVKWLLNILIKTKLLKNNNNLIVNYIYY